MSKALRKILQNAKLAGVKIGQPGERRVRSGQGGPVAAAQPLFADRPRSRDYTLPEPAPVQKDPYADYMTVTAATIAHVDQRSQYQFSLELAQRDFRIMGLSEAQIKAGFSYLLIQKVGLYGVAQPMVSRIHPHKGGTGPHDLEFMRALAARESRRLRTLDKDQGIYRQSLVIIPPEDKASGRVRWVAHEDGYNTMLEKYLDTDSMTERMGPQRADLVKKFTAQWSDLAPLNGAALTASTEKIDYMKAVRMSCGDLSGGPAA